MHSDDAMPPNPIDPGSQPNASVASDLSRHRAVRGAWNMRLQWVMRQQTLARSAFGSAGATTTQTTGERTDVDQATQYSAALLLQALATAGLVSAAGPGLIRPARAADKLVVGVIYVGPKDDYGYSQAQAQAAAAIKKLPGVTVVEEERVAETVDVQKTMGSMIEQDGAVLIFPTSFGYFDPHAIKMAEKYPNVRFAHCGGLWTEGKHPKNAGSYFGYIDECQYLNGVVAGHTTKSKKLGFIAAKPIPQVLRNINAFTLGAQEREARHHHHGDLHRRLVAAGQGSGSREQPHRPGRRRHHDARGQPQGDRRDGASGAAFMSAATTPTSPRWRPRAISPARSGTGSRPTPTHVKAAMEGKPMINFLRGGLKEGFVKTSAYGKAVSEGARKNADAIKAKMMTGDYVIFKGPLKDNAGKVVIAGGTAYKQTDLALEKMDYLVSGVVGHV